MLMYRYAGMVKFNSRIKALPCFFPAVLLNLFILRGLKHSVTKSQNNDVALKILFGFRTHVLHL